MMAPPRLTVPEVVEARIDRARILEQIIIMCTAEGFPPHMFHEGRECLFWRARHGYGRNRVALWVDGYKWPYRVAFRPMHVRDNSRTVEDVAQRSFVGPHWPALIPHQFFADLINTIGPG